MSGFVRFCLALSGLSGFYLSLFGFVRPHQILSGFVWFCPVLSGCCLAFVRGCLVLAAQADGTEVETIEGLSDSGELADLQATFRTRNALQCGYCTPGMLLTAQALLADNPAPSRNEIREYLSGNYCRCTGYQAIVDAIESVAAARRGVTS